MTGIYTWLAGGAALILIVGLHIGSDKIKASQLDKARTELVSYKVTVKEQQNVNKSNLQTIAEITRANQAWADRFETTVGDYNDSIIKLKAQLEAERIKRNSDRLEAKAELERILANDETAATWGSRTVPDSISEFVRDTITPANQDTEQ